MKKITTVMYEKYFPQIYSISEEYLSRTTILAEL